jgi:mannose-6-phosphate isomerase-like protein (cupin superfamily)
LQGGLIVDIRNINRVPAFITKDGSEIRELLAWRNSCIRRQSLAEARLPPGGSTTPHRHIETEEIYYVLEGRGLMRVGEEAAELGPGDAVAIPPGQSHTITNTGAETLKFLCCCAPCYEHDDTVLE